MEKNKVRSFLNPAKQILHLEVTVLWTVPPLGAAEQLKNKAKFPQFFFLFHGKCLWTGQKSELQGRGGGRNHHWGTTTPYVMSITCNSCQTATARTKWERRNISDCSVYITDTLNSVPNRAGRRRRRRRRGGGDEEKDVASGRTEKAGQRDERTQKGTSEHLIIFHMINFIWGRWPGSDKRGARKSRGWN